MAAFTARFHSGTSIVILTFLVLVLVPYYNCQGKEIVRKSESPLNTSPKFKPVALPLMVDPIVSKTTPEIIRYYGYRDESHQVTSEDGYISTWHRVLPATSPDKFKGPVIIQHGIFGSSSEWFVNTKENLLPFKLADAGYDIWLGNSRGGNYARGHVNMTTSNPKFWDFSVNEMGKYGIPAAIDYILAKTGHSKLHYIGYSMGAATLCVTMSHRPEYNEKVKLLVGLAPAVYLSNLTSGFVRLFTLAQLLPPQLVQILTNGEILPFGLGKLVNIIGSNFCSLPLMTELLCSNIHWLYSGWDMPQLNTKQLHVYFGQALSPISVRTGVHLLQFISSGLFREYDFGKYENMQRYGKPSPPLYSLSKTTIPVAILYGPNDALVNRLDVDRLGSELPNVILKSPVDHKYFNHHDFELSRDANTLVNDRILKLLNSY